MSPDAPAGAGAIDRKEHEVLVVDDDPASRYATARLLRSVGFRMREAASGREALDVADAGLSAIVLDVHLPDIDGFELCRILRAKAGLAHVPVMHLSAAYVTDKDKVRGLDAGADAYLTHPVEPAVIVATLQALVRTRKAESAMRSSEAKFRAIYAHAPSGICLIDPDWTISEANPAMLSLLKRNEPSVIGHRLTEFVPPEWHALLIEQLPQGPGSVWRGELPLVLSSGKQVYAEWRVAQLPDTRTLMAVATDISERRELELARVELLEREQAARAEAEQLGRQKDDMIAVLSHELRAPLNAIMGWTHVLQKRGGPEETLRGLAAIERNGLMQARLLSDILDVSRINMGKLQLDLQPVDPAQLLHATLDAIQPLLQENANPLVLDIDAPLAPVLADPARFQQIIWNLLSNAIKFSPNGAEIRVTLKGNPRGVRLSVQDLGVGIEAAFLPRLFERFAQGNVRSNRQFGGLGLGLSIVKHLVQLHGGHVAAESDGVGRGATFHVDLPFQAIRSVDPALPHPAEVRLAANRAEPASLRGSRVLVVDDDPEVLATLQIILGDRGASVHTAATYEQALEAIASFEPHVLVSDLGMSGHSGYELIHEVRRREGPGRRLPAIALSAFSRQQDVQKALDAGFDLHCAKPLQPAQLVSAIEHVCQAEQESPG